MKAKVEISAFTKINWPQDCVLCLKPATKEGFEEIGGGQVPYCETCHEKVERLDRWKDNIFGIALVFGIIGFVLSIVGKVVEEGWLGLLSGKAWLLIGSSALIFMGIFYALFWVLVLPLRIVLHKKLAAPGVKILDSKKPGVIVLKFTNSDYADKFRQVNHSQINTT